jgi:hypothetical protein
MKVRDNLADSLSQSKADDLEQVQKLNRLMVELDEINYEKRMLNQELLEKIKFVRTLQAELGTADNGDITEMIDKELEA